MEGHQAKRRRLLDASRNISDRAAEAAAAPPQEAVDAWSDDDVLLPSDVEACIASMRNEFLAHAAAKGLTLPPLVLLTQLCSVLKDRTQLDRELDSLQRQNIIRSFKLASGLDEHGIMLTADYRGAVHHAAEQATTRQQQPVSTEHAAESAAGPKSAAQPTHQQPTATVQPANTSAYTLAADAFCQSVLPAHTDVSISRSRLLALLGAYSPQHPTSGPMPPSSLRTTSKTSTPDDLLTRLLHMGAVGRHATDDNVLVFSIPGAGPVIKSLMAGRKELVGVVKRKQYGEVAERVLLGTGSTGSTDKRSWGQGQGGGFLPEPGAGGRGAAGGGVTTSKAAQLVGAKLRTSILSIRFHLKDLIGRGALERVASPSGPLIRLVAGRTGGEGVVGLNRAVPGAGRGRGRGR